jgi:cell division protein FtsQ
VRPLKGATGERGFRRFGLDAMARALARLRSRRTAIPARDGRPAPKLRRALRVERFDWRERFRRGRPPRFLGLGLLVALFAATGLAGAVHGGHFAALRRAPAEAFAAATRAAGFGLAEVRLTGASRLTPGEVMEAMGLDHTTSLLAFDAEAARRRLLSHAAIKSASVRVYLPATVAVTLAEREAFAIWQRAGQVMLIDREGRAIGPYDDPRFSHLPLVVGEGAERRVAEFGALLDPYPTIRSRVRAGVLVADRRWTLKLADGVDVMLPERHAAEAVALLARLDRESGLLNRDVAAIDLRLADRVVVRLTDRAAAIRSDALRARSRMPQPYAPATPQPQPQRPGRVT